MYVAMDRKPENGEEIHNGACRQSGIMMHIRIIKYARSEADQEYDENNLPHGTKLLK